jgi:hypothetical protein
MSGESSPRAAVGAEELERVFGEAAVCNRCGASVAAYRIVATFLHDTVAVRAYCASCYPQIEGEYHAGGSGLLIGFDEFARRFGAPAPTPSPATPVDRLLTRLLRAPELRSLVPASEAFARRTRALPYRFRVVLEIDGASQALEMAVSPGGRVEALAGDAPARERLGAMLESSARG